MLAAHGARHLLTRPGEATQNWRWGPERRRRRYQRAPQFTREVRVEEICSLARADVPAVHQWYFPTILADPHRLTAAPVRMEDRLVGGSPGVRTQGRGAPELS